MFQAGLVYLLVRKFKTTIIVTIFYLALSVGLHVWTVVSVIFPFGFNESFYGCSMLVDFHDPEVKSHIDAFYTNLLTSQREGEGIYFNVDWLVET